MLSLSELIGKVVMVMITFRNGQADIIGYKQMHGTVRRASENEGVIIFVEKDKKEESLPPDLIAFQIAEAGNIQSQFQERSSSTQTIYVCGK